MGRFGRDDKRARRPEGGARATFGDGAAASPLCDFRPPDSVAMSPSMRLVLPLLLLMTAVPAAADPLDASDAAAEVALLDGWRQSDGTRIAGVEISLAPGWHTYWRVPGAAGVPPVFDWSASTNLAAVAYEWPRPIVFENFGLRMFGYADRVVLPVRLTPKDPAEPMNVALDVTFGVCREICSQAERRIEARLAPDAPAAGRPRIEAALGQRALTASEAGVVGVTCALAPAGADFALTAEVTFAEAPGPGQTAIIEAGPDLYAGEAATRTAGRTLVARAPVAAGTGPVLARDDLRVTVLDDRRAVDIRGCDAPG